MFTSTNIRCKYILLNASEVHHNSRVEYRYEVPSRISVQHFAMINNNIQYYNVNECHRTDLKNN